MLRGTLICCLLACGLPASSLIGLAACGRAVADQAAPTADTPQPGLEQYALYDGPSGVARDYWNRGVGLHWRNALGDWRDADDKPQGLAAFAAASAPTGKGPQKIEFDVTSLVKWWLSRGNTGALLRASSGACEFASRENPEQVLRPTLVVTTTAGPKVCRCTADATLSSSTYKSLGQGTTFSVGRAKTAVVQFDLSSVSGDVGSATLALHATKPSGGTIEVLCLDAPTIYTGGGEPKLGLAKDYPYDKGIASHADVVFATDFSGDDWRQRYFTNGNVADPTFGEDVWLRSTYLRGQFVKGSVSSCALDYLWTTHRQAEPEEIYFRYYLWLDDNWGSTVDGNKMPGLAGRYGIWQDDHWYVVTGNGGSRTTGVISQKPRGKAICGWSLRGHGSAKPADENPYRDLTAVGTYAYHVDQKGLFGDHWGWGATLLQRQRWYSIEQYAKMNTIEGPFDELGNGKGRNDGVLRVWVDGVPVFEKSDIRFRHHPAIKIDEVWLNWYHGGTKPAQATHHWRMGNIVVARSYIGPLARADR